MANKQTEFLGHPSGLSTLFATEMWERFSYYGMRALLSIFLIATVETGGFGLTESEARAIYGTFTALVYLTPLIGGILADKIFGQRMTIYIGGITMALGQFMLAFAAMQGNTMEVRQFWFFAGLGALILGNGFFKPNISTMVGQLYDQNDPRKDGGFTIFYMGINLGAFIAPLTAGYLGENVAWHYGYLTSGVGMLLGVTWFILRAEKTLGHIGLPPKADKNRTRLEKTDWIKISACVTALILGVVGFLYGWGAMSSMAQAILMIAAAVAGSTYIIRSIIKGTETREQWKRVAVIMILALFNICFLIGFEQAGTTLSFFASNNTDRALSDFTIPVAWFQSINAIFIVTLAPLFSMMWVWLGKRNLNPRTPFKFAWGMSLISLGAIVMALVSAKSGEGASTVLMSPLWLVLVYLLFTLAELCISPIGLAMITKLAPPKITSTFMGIWMFSFAAGNLGAAQADSIVKSISGKESLPTMFWCIAGLTAVATAALFVLGPWLSKMMKSEN